MKTHFLEKPESQILSSGPAARSAPKNFLLKVKNFRVLPRLASRDYETFGACEYTAPTTPPPLTEA